MHRQNEGTEPDLLVIGAGAGGMTAALSAALHGLRVVLYEATTQVGGTTSTSAGTLWIPGNRHGVAAGHHDTIDAAWRYLDTLLGPDDERGLRQAFFDSAAEAIGFLEEGSELKFASAGKHPDYLPWPGAGIAGRALAPLPFDGRKLDGNFDRVRPPSPDFMVLGGMMVGKADVLAVIRRYRSWGSFVHTIKLLTRYGLDRLRYRRGTRLVMGNALVARLYYSLLQAGVEIRYENKLAELIHERERITGAIFDTPGGPHSMRAQLGVVLATGGIGHNAALRDELMDQPVAFDPAPKRPSDRGAQGATRPPLPSRGNSPDQERDRLSRGEGAVDCLMDEAIGGVGIQVARHRGAGLERHPHNFFWQPVSRVPVRGGGYRLFPHLYLDRTKPGIIAVDAAGLRFVNEADSYHHFVEAMLQRQKEGVAAVPCHLICNAGFVRQYGLGVIPPGTRNLGRYVRSGYIVTDASLEGLAWQLGIDGAGLIASVERHNQDAGAGVDTLFGKGDSELNRLNGDPGHQPNPCLGAIAQGPYVGLAIWPADAANSAGLEVDADGRVRNANGEPIPGLYACGNDMASIMRGVYPGPGITLGPAVVFGYRIGRHAASSKNHQTSIEGEP